MSGAIHTGLAAFVVSLCAFAAPAAPDTSPPPRRPPREWTDEHGNVIARLEGSGRLTLFSWDSNRRLVQVEGMADLYTPADARGSLGVAAWAHHFEYSADNGSLVKEIDCFGRAHEFPSDENRAVDPRGCTALKDHEHVREAGFLGRSGARR